MLKTEPLYNILEYFVNYVNNTIDDLRIPPGNRLEKLSGNLDGHFSIRINDQWRIVFRFEDGGAEDVGIQDYHR